MTYQKRTHRQPAQQHEQTIATAEFTMLPKIIEQNHSSQRTIWSNCLHPWLCGHDLTAHAMQIRTHATINTANITIHRKRSPHFTDGKLSTESLKFTPNKDCWKRLDNHDQNRELNDDAKRGIPKKHGLLPIEVDGGAPLLARP